MFAVGARQVHWARPILLDDLPASGQIIRRQTKLRRENVHGSHWEEAERDSPAGDPVHDFVDRPVTPGGDDSFKTFRGGVSREHFRFPRARGRAQDRAARDRFYLGPQAICTGAPGCGVENNDGIFQNGKKGRGFGLFFKLGGRNLPA